MTQISHENHFNVLIYQKIYAHLKINIKKVPV